MARGRVVALFGKDPRVRFAASVLGFLGQSDLRSFDLSTAFQLVVIEPRIRLRVLTPIGTWMLSGVHDFV